MIVNIKVYPFVCFYNNGYGYLNKKAINLLGINVDEQFIDFKIVPDKKIAFIYVANIPGVQLSYNANLFKFCNTKKVRSIFELYKIESKSYRLIIDDEPIKAGDFNYYPLINIPYEQ